MRGKHCIKVIQSTLTITNKALFPISYVIDDIDTRVVGHAHVYQDARVANRSGIVPAESSYEYKDKPVSIPGGVQDKRFYVTVGFSARYGRPGNEKYPIKAKRRLEFVETPGSRALDVFVYPDIEEHGGQ